MEKTVSEATTCKRPTRIYKDESIDSKKIKLCLVNASLAPASNNLHLSEIYHINNKETLGNSEQQKPNKTATQLRYYRPIEFLLH